MKPAPFPNTGSICYFNSLLQCILASIEKESFLKIKNPDTPINLYTIAYTNKLLKEKKEQILGDGQQCAGEMYTSLMSAYDHFPKFANLFFYEITTTMMCKRCGNQNRIFERENIYTIPNKSDAIESIGHSAETVESRCDIGNCGNSKKIKYSRLSKMAPIMVFQVKIYNAANAVKIPDYIKFENGSWELCGIVHHYGNQNGGHYVACVKIEKKWWVADDANVYEGRLPQESAHMIFYKFLYINNS